MSDMKSLAHAYRGCGVIAPTDPQQIASELKKGIFRPESYFERPKTPLKKLPRVSVKFSSSAVNNLATDLDG